MRAVQDRATPPPEPDDGSLGVDLVHALDDESAPRTVTVYPRDPDDVTTTWLTVDVEHAVDLAEMG